MRTLLLVVLAGCTVTPGITASEIRVVEVTRMFPEAPPPAPAAPRVPVGPPIARTVAVVDHEFGVAVADPYRWMEGDDNAELRTWLRAQASHAAGELAKLPGRDKLYARIRTLGLGVSAVFDVELASGRMFHEVLAAGDQLARLAVREPDGTTRILVDPAARGTAKVHVSLNRWSASPDGRLISYVTSSGGGEVGVLHVMDVATGKELPDQIGRIWGEGAASWLPDGKAFFYTQMAAPRPGTDPMIGMIARLHTLGQAADQDITILGRDAGASLKLASEEWPGLRAQPGTDWVMAWIGGAHSEQRLAIARLAELDRSGTSKTPWKIVADYPDGIEGGVIHGDRLYLRTYKDAPNRKIVSVPLASPELTRARVDVPEDLNASLVSAPAARDALYLLHRVNGRARLSRWVWNARAASPISLPVDGWAPDLATDLARDGIVFQLETWVAPGAYYAYDPGTRKVTPTGLASSATEVSSQVVAEEVEVTSADGTAVPLSILHLKGLALDGSHPAILSAYGAYGSSQTPGFGPTRLAWLERGGVFAIAHVRGGGERGRQWQDDGSRERKLNGIRDFIACGEYLVEHRYTSRKTLAGVGASMGGVMIGRAITVRPDLFAAANIDVGIVDPLRILFAENGANQKAELGDPATEVGYKSILEMDPYQHVQPNTPYPAVIFTVGLNDHRVAPWMTGKMAARLLASTTSGKPILVRIDPDAGHGVGSTRDQAYAERADVWSFYLAAFGDPEFAAK